MKKILCIAASLFACCAIAFPSAAMAAAEEGQSAEETTQAETEDSGGAGAAEILMILGIFTVTFAAAGIGTYKYCQRKNRSQDS
ncbi:MAG: hypothetical protein MR434_05255 [Ruminococcus sp.]|nr:hypothetical protein [Ruminococcus sp.]